MSVAVCVCACVTWDRVMRGAIMMWCECGVSVECVQWELDAVCVWCWLATAATSAGLLDCNDVMSK